MVGTKFFPNTSTRVLPLRTVPRWTSLVWLVPSPSAPLRFDIGWTRDRRADDFEYVIFEGVGFERHEIGWERVPAGLGPVVKTFPAESGVEIAA